MQKACTGWLAILALTLDFEILTFFFFVIFVFSFNCVTVCSEGIATAEHSQHVEANSDTLTGNPQAPFSKTLPSAGVGLEKM